MKDDNIIQFEACTCHRTLPEPSLLAVSRSRVCCVLQLAIKAGLSLMHRGSTLEVAGSTLYLWKVYKNILRVVPVVLLAAC